MSVESKTGSRAPADLIVDRLIGTGVRATFGMPGGGSNLDLIAAGGRRGLPFILAHSETASALMACAQAELTGSPGACLCTLGPGVASILNGVAHAALDRVPLLVFADAAGDPAYAHQRLDHRGLFGVLGRPAVSIGGADAACAIEEALAACRAPVPGPVLVECLGNSLEITPGVFSRPEKTPGVISAAESTPGEILPAGLLKGTRKPVVIAGLGVRDPEVVTALRAVCGRRGIPALVTYKAKGVIPDRHPLFGGVFTLGVLERGLIEEADLILGIGFDPVELLPRRWPYRQPVVALSAWPLETSQVPFASTVVGPLTSLLSELDRLLPPATAWHTSGIKRHADAQRSALRQYGPALAPTRVVEIVSAAVGNTCIITVDAGAHMVPVMGLWPVADAGRVLISNGLSTMGFALPAAVGAALVDRGRPVVAVTGDGGLLMCAGELRTAARERLRVLVVVFNDGELSLIKVKQEQRGLPESGVRTGAVDFTRLAESMGAASFRATDTRSLETALARALECAGPALIDVHVNPASYGAMLKAVRG